MDNTIYLRLSDLRPWEINPRSHDIPFLKRLIRENGFVAYPAVREGQLFVGHGRTKALADMKRGNEEPPFGVQVDDDGEWIVPCISLDHLSEQQAKTFAINENLANARGEWDKRQLQKLFKQGVVDKKETGFTPKQLRRIMAKKKAPVQVVRRSAVGDVPDSFFPSEPQYDIPLLDLNMQADYVDRPFIKWGTLARSEQHAGTVHFYTDDYKFDALWKNPLKLVDTECVIAVEPNFTTHSQLPKALMIFRTYQKRYMARLWQSKGVGVLVDLNVGSMWRELNLLGVPRGWGSYCTRALVGQESLLAEEHELATLHSEGNLHLFVVYGGNADTKAFCAEQGWIWVPEYQNVVHQGASE